MIILGLQRLMLQGGTRMAFSAIRELLSIANKKQQTIASCMLEVEQNETGRTKEEIITLMTQQFDVMIEAAHKGVEQPMMSRTGLTGGDGYRVEEYRKKGISYLGTNTLQAMAYALSVNEVNAAMGRIVATPTAGSAGILPGVLIAIYDQKVHAKEAIIQGLFTAAAIGLVIANAASISGAAGGCQAEIGSATAMAAGAAVEIAGGSPEQVGNAVGLALKNSLGLVCDPVGGLVEIPCIIRNGLHAVTALAAADMALAGVRSVIPPDEVIHAMYAIGNEMPESLRETGLGGLAATPTGKRLRERLFGKMEQQVVEKA